MWNDAIPDPAAQQEIKRKAIIRAAAQAFSRQGSHSVTLEDVAERLGVSKAALYRYIPNKHALILACQDEALEIAAQAMERASAEQSTGLAKIRRSLQLYLLDTMEQLGVPALILEDNALRGDDALRILQKRDIYEKQMRALVIEGHADGSILPVEPKMAVFMVLGAIHWVAKWYRPDGSWSPEMVADTIAALATRALDPTPAATLAVSFPLDHAKEDLHAI